MGMAESLVGLAGLDWSVPYDTNLSRRQKTLQVAIEVATIVTGLRLLVACTGIRTLGEGEWKTINMR